jgi:alpha-methylacyl-CoA racemase
MGPLSGYRVIEIAGIGPGQLCGMLLAEMGAQVLRIVRLEDADAALHLPAASNLMNRSRPAIAVDLKRQQGVELVLRLCETADVLFEGFRPGVMERLGLGPEPCQARNPRLVYGRMTGWGQEGPLAREAGHDTNFLALTGALAAIGERDRGPVLPLNLVADFGGGGLYLALGVVAALLETSRSGCGQVVDTAVVDGVASLTTLFHGLLAAGLWQERRGSNLLDGGAPFMRTYRTRDGGHVAVAALENRFYRNLLEGLGITDLDPARQLDTKGWPELGRRLEQAFARRDRDDWAAHFEGRDACVTPVLTFSEATRHPHNLARGTFVEVDGIVQPAPAPRFSRTPGAVRSGPGAGGDAAEVLGSWGMTREEVLRLAATGALRARPVPAGAD